MIFYQLSVVFGYPNNWLDTPVMDLKFQKSDPTDHPTM